MITRRRSRSAALSTAPSNSFVHKGGSLMALRRIARIFGITAAFVMSACDRPPESEPAETDEPVGEAEQALTSTATVPAAADTWVGEILLNQSHGSDTTLHVTGLGIQRSLVRMDQEAIASAVGTGTVQSASLVLTIQSANNLWGPNGRPIRLHRLTTAWEEQGATWLCPNDTNLSNLLPDCNPLWFMGGLLQTPPWSRPRARRRRSRTIKPAQCRST